MVVITRTGSSSFCYLGFSTPSAFMRDASVVGLIPSSSAVPSSPDILPLVSKAASIFSRSRASRTVSVKGIFIDSSPVDSSAIIPVSNFFPDKLNCKRLPWLTMSARSITFCSSRPVRKLGERAHGTDGAVLAGDHGFPGLLSLPASSFAG